MKNKRLAWIAAVLLGLALLVTLTAQHAHANCEPLGEGNACSALYQLRSNVSALAPDVPAPDHQISITEPLLPAAGSLIHADHRLMEAEAHDLLTASKAFRQTISPHTERDDFDTLVANFDYASGFDRELPGQSKTLAQRIDEADRALRRARNLYAFLAVYADESRFRGDGDIDNCPAAPLNDDPIADPPVVDMCNFAARMRESVREAAYLRMIFGQQFTADAMGLHFSGTEIVGGEAFVIKEVRQLQMAETQYDQALDIVKEGLTIALGSGCFVSDFYTQPEWSLLSRAIDGKERAKHHIAIRKSYLDEMPNLSTGHAAAQDEFRNAAAAQYVAMIGTAGQAARKTAEHCVRGTNPDNPMIAEMALRMLDTRNAARTLSQGRNVFGFDVRLTPARPFRTSTIPGSVDIGILDEALAAAEDAKTLQRDEEDATRTFDYKQSELIKAIQSIKDGRDERIQAMSGCNRAAPEYANDAAYFACVERVLVHLASCDPATPDAAAFQACTTNHPDAPAGTMRQSRQELRVAFLAIRGVEREIANMHQRIANEEWRNEAVNSELLTNGVAQSAIALAQDIVNCCAVEYGSNGFSFAANPGAPISAVLSQASVLRQAVADMKTANIESEAVIRDFFLDLAELQVKLEVTIAEYNAQLTEYEANRDQVRHDVIEAQRERAYLQNSPANDPSFRLVRDSKRLVLASQLEYAARVAYLAARRAEYEYATRLPASNISISEIYRARTADDILRFLTKLESTANNLIVGDSQLQPKDFTVSVARHVLGLTDEYLGLTGAAAEAERVKRFRAWVAQNVATNDNGKPVLKFNFSTSLAENGIFSNVLGENFDNYWLFKMGGVGRPKNQNTGFAINLVSEETALDYRGVLVEQSGITHLRALSGCIFDYRLIHPAALLGLDWPKDQPAEAALSAFNAGINGANGENTNAFFNRPVSASNWQVTIFTAPEAGLPDMNLLKLTDIQFKFSTTYATREAVEIDPNHPDCVRTDF